jgi:peptidoglycan hydrolase CwlO-like protein
MGFGSTAKKLQQVVDVADELYAKINDLKSDLAAIRDTIDETNSRVGELESEMESQQELLEAIALAEDIDIEELGTEDETDDTSG